MKKPTLKQVAESCGVSVNTVSLALRGSDRLPESTRERIQRAAQKINYVPNRTAQALKGSSTHTIGLIMNVLSDDGHLKFFRAVNEQLDKLGFSVLLETVQDNEIETALARLTSSGVDGIIVSFGAEEIFDKLMSCGLKNICLANKKLWSESIYDQVYYSEYEGSCLLMKHLLDLGHRRIGFITATSEMEFFDRKNAYLDMLQEAGVEVRPEWIESIPYGQLSQENIQSAVDRFVALEDRPTAIFAYHDEVALKTMYCLKKSGIRVPEDVSVAGINNIWAGEFGYIPLTSVELYMDQQGRMSAEVIVDRIRNEELPLVSKKITPRLFERESVVRISLPDL